jgi:poly(3-hydroxybutyrate) depolymerase
MLAAYPEVFAGGAIIAGLAYGSATTMPEAFDRMRGHGGPSRQKLARLVSAASLHQGPWPTISVWQGSADGTVAPSNADAILAQWQEIHGMDASPTRTETVDGQRRQVWCDTSGRELIEKFSIAGMGHGTPLKTSGDDRLGEAGPFMLEAGISSTRHIARFWGIVGAPRRTKSSIDTAAAGSGAIMQPGADAAEKPRVARLRPAEKKPLPDARGSSTGVAKAIEDALRAAGLMR